MMPSAEPKSLRSLSNPLERDWVQGREIARGRGWMIVQKCLSGQNTSNFFKLPRAHFVLIFMKSQYMKSVCECCDRQLHFAVPPWKGQSNLVD